MKSLLTLLLLATMAILHHHASAQKQRELPCCRNVTGTNIPVRMVRNVLRTPGHCVVNAFIVITAKKEFCVDPESVLVRKLREAGRI